MMTTRIPKAPKPVYKPQIVCVDAAAGMYTVSSERYRYILYDVNVLDQTCTCEAAVKWGRVACKHRALAAEVHALATSCFRTGATWQMCPTCGASFYGTPGVKFCACTLVSTPKPHAGNASGLLEAFGVE